MRSGGDVSALLQDKQESWPCDYSRIAGSAGRTFIFLVVFIAFCCCIDGIPHPLPPRKEKLESLPCAL